MANRIPSKEQIEFMDAELGIFFHFGIRTFNEDSRDWDMIPMDPDTFNPTDLDCEQWIRAIKSFGAKYAVLTTKHHDGFALWQSDYSSYSVRQCKWRGGKGDVVREFTDACRKYGIRPCLYYSISEFNAPALGDRYTEVILGQVTELLTNYGPIDLLWFDGCGSGNIQFDMNVINDTVRRLGPKLVGDTRWIGNEWGYSTLYNNNYAYADGNFRPGECDACMTRLGTENFWFYNETHNNCRRTVDELVGMYYLSIGRGANLLLNIAPDRRGLLEDEDIRLMTAAHDEISRRIHGCALMTGKMETGERNGHQTFTVEFPRPVLVDHALLAEDQTTGDHVRAFSIYSLCYADSERIELFRGATIGHKTLCRFPTIRAKILQVEVTDGDGEATLTMLRPLYVGNGSRDQVQG